MSIVTIICLIIAKEINTLLARKLPVPVPVELIAVSEPTHALPHHTYTHTHTHDAFYINEHWWHGGTAGILTATDFMLELLFSHVQSV